MNLTDVINQALEFVASWCGTTFPRIFAAFLGVMICVAVLSFMWSRRLRALPALAWTAFGFFLLAVAIDPQLIYFLARSGEVIRVRIVMGVVSLVVLVITLESIRQTRLQERYALLWVATGLIILLGALFPQIVEAFSSVMGTQYVTSVVAVVFTFLVLVAFHFSLAMSAFQEAQTKIAQRCAVLETRLSELEGSLAARGVIPGRPVGAEAIEVVPEPVAKAGLSTGQGTRVAAAALIAVFVVATLVVGVLAPQAMVGDEVTHFYMLTSQAKDLSQPVFTAEIPRGWGGTEIRRYPHAFMWHYLGAAVYSTYRQSFLSVQIYQVVFWLQFLVVAYLLARDRAGMRSKSPLLYLAVLASLPMGLLFSVFFYQDVPVAAQILTAFYLLHRRRWYWASLFMAFSLTIKETTVLFLPAFLVLLVLWTWRDGRRWRAGLAIALSCAMIYGSMWMMSHAIVRYGHTGYYPMVQFQKIVNYVGAKFAGRHVVPVSPRVTDPRGARMVSPYEAEIIVNHPGDLRIPINFLVYGGILLWLVALAGVAGWVVVRLKRPAGIPLPPSSLWLWGTGFSYTVAAAYFLRSAPDARFFLPAVPFLLLPLVEWAVCLPRPKAWLPLVVAVAILQGGQVLRKTYELRQVSPELREAMAWLGHHPIHPPKLFMYPEGNYRLFPYPHNWYLQYHLREFWHATPDVRIEMLHEFDIGAVVVKKYLVSAVDDKVTNLGVYPTYFVRDIAADPRFKKVFENSQVAIYLVPDKNAKKKR